MSALWRYSAAETDEHIAGFARVLAHSFARTETETAQWLARHARSDLRVLTDTGNGRVVAGLILIPMGQFFGGRSVPMHGVAGVGVAPEARGQGAAAELMRCALREMPAAGFPISGLYPRPRNCTAASATSRRAAALRSASRRSRSGCAGRGMTGWPSDRWSRATATR